MKQHMHVGVYPYSSEFDPLIRHANLLDPSFQIVALIAPTGWGMTGKQITNEAQDGKWIVASEFEPFLSNIDTVFIPDFHVDENVETKIIKKLEVVIPNLQRIICAANLAVRNKEHLKALCVQSGCMFEDLNTQRELEEYGLVKQIAQHPSIHPINTPILVISGLWEETDKFELSLALREMFVKDGYNITQIGSRNCCELFGFHSFPDFMFDKHTDATDKIVYFNQWIKRLESIEKPDIIVLAVPGALQNLSEQVTRGFGVLPHIVFQAVVADFFLFCTMYGADSIEPLQELSTMCKHKFGCEIDMFHMANTYFDLIASEMNKQAVLNRVYRETVSQAIEENCKNSPIPIVNALDQPSLDVLYRSIINKLSGEDVQIVL